MNNGAIMTRERMKRSLSNEQNSWNKDRNWAGFGFKE